MTEKTSARMKMASTTPLPLVVRGPTWISVDNPNPVPGSTGICVMQIFFQGSVEVHSVKFRNYYVQNITIKSRSTDDAVPTTHCICGSEMQPHLSWRTTIDHRILMSNPNCEDGCQDYVLIHNHEALTSWSNVVALAFSLRQPSSKWKMFGIKELEICGKSNLPPVIVLTKNCDDRPNSPTTNEATDGGQTSCTHDDETSGPSTQMLPPEVQEHLSDIKIILQRLGSLKL